MPAPFRVGVSGLARSGRPRREARRGEIEGLFVTSSEVPAGVEVEVEVEVIPVGGAVEVVGVVRAPWRGQCRRCLGPVGGQLEVPVREVFEPRPVEGETYPLDHDEVDLAALAREAVLLELPPAPLCQETCRGFCPGCGTDRNQSLCSCAPAPDPRWSVLEELRDRE